ncbi:DUF805 domain-containing protein [Erwinia psidii]|uniref:DUF805 domain-containing protein n=1 Tax=Erwinia psidii TaxID=69224 RepID=A0A3N6S7R6_9GAMM|nr:DUF805 domain-containing protein [Erwinia psidii]MCX8959186.1 DUF805 domain-containing protein [Erwinia psidii]MCX8962196.1 DUF805 domain-containing protein [Erwinia psidii]MCX8966728.1 DUF805 domain-containing protein [Erwinia psidii]RQM37180.1 DUF805 domain-containing protein [Erwinia psidii]
MTLQAWCFSYRGRLGRRDFWIWLVLWLVLLVVLFMLAANEWMSAQTAAFCVVSLLWPTSAVVVKRLHDRNKPGYWGFLLIAAWMMMAGNWEMLPTNWQGVAGRFLPTLILVTMTLELGVLPGTRGDNRFGTAACRVNYPKRRTPDYQ